MRRIQVIDGGMGQELIKRSTRPVTPMWSAEVMLNEPELVSQLHLEFIQSGATLITLNTYTATPQRLTRDASIDLLEPLHKAAIDAALLAREKSQLPNIEIAGCLPPLMASYRPDFAPDFDTCVDTYRQLVELQKDASDIFICETMSSIREAKAACIAANESNKSVWVAFSVDDEQPLKLRGGESLQEASDAILKLNPAAMLLNCSRPEAIMEGLPILASTGVKVGAYANGFTSVTSLYPGTTVESLGVRKDLSPTHYAEFASKWVELGATIVGGCCEVGPEHIQCLAEMFETN